MEQEKTKFQIAGQNFIISLLIVTIGFSIVQLVSSGNFESLIAVPLFIGLLYFMPFFAIPETWHAPFTSVLFVLLVYAFSRIKSTKLQIASYSILLTIWTIYGVLCTSIVTGE